MTEAELRAEIAELDGKISLASRSFRDFLNAKFIEPHKLVGKRISGVCFDWADKLVIATDDGNFCVFAIDRGYHAGEESLTYTHDVNRSDLKAAGIQLPEETIEMDDLSLRRHKLVIQLAEYENAARILKTADPAFVKELMDQAQARVDATPKDGMAESIRRQIEGR